MNRRTAAVLFTLATCTVLAWAGDEPKIYEISWHERWKVGQVATVTEHEVGDTDTTMNGAPSKSVHEVFDATYVVRCDQLDEKGDAARQTVFVRSWKRIEGDQTDESISGLRVEVDGKIWKLPDGKTAGPLAKKWLDKRFAKEHDNLLSRLAPPKMAVGQTWKFDPTTAAEALAKSVDNASFDPAGVVLEIQMVSVDGTPPDASGKYELKMHVPIGGNVPGLRPGAVVLPGSAAEMVRERSGPLTTSTMLGTEHLDMTMTTNIEVSQQDQKLAISRKVKTISDKKTVAGGEIPEPPKPPGTTLPPTGVLADLKNWDAATTQARRSVAEGVARRLPDFTLLRLEAFSCGGQTHEVAIYSHAKTGLEFVLVPGGTFLMGSPESEKDPFQQGTQHSVTLTTPFLISRTPCTQAAYERIVGSNPSSFRGPTLPVEMVSWEASSAFCAKAGLSLPTGAQWEFVCRAGTTTTWCCGDSEATLGDFAWYDVNSGGQTHPVAQKKPNAFGLYDMHGNVWQWCEDWYGDFPTGAVTDPSGASGGAYRVFRGGGWGSPAEFARSAFRSGSGSPPGVRARDLGFRPSKTVPAE